MSEYLSDRAKSACYSFSILLGALMVRVLVGLGKPLLSMEQSIIVGLTTVVCLSPMVYRVVYGEEMLTTGRKRLTHGLAMLLAGGLFVHAITLAS